MKSERAFFGVFGLLFAASATLTIVWCGSMRAMGGMPMPGGWTMSMMWMRMPGQSWPGSAASFLAMWTAMMVAMMLPSLVPTLSRFRARFGGALTAVASTGYFFVWIVAGIAVFAGGVALAAIEMRHAALSRAVPLAGGGIVAIAGSIQFRGWKARHLSRCHDMGRDMLRPSVSGGLRHGIRLGLRCVCCCANWTAILLVIGMMDLRAMAVVTAAITAERLAPLGERVASHRERDRRGETASDDACPACVRHPQT